MDRNALLSQLELVQPGLASTDIAEQSSCFVFVKGHVHTYNTELFCRARCTLKIEGAVVADALLETLRKYSDADIAIAPNDENSELLIKAKRRRSGITMQEEITMPLGDVKQPAEWFALPDEFIAALAEVQHCALLNTKDDFWLTCIHVMPKGMEACDNWHYARYKIATGFAAPFLIRRTAVQHLINNGVTHAAEDDDWVHFACMADGKPVVAISVRRYEDEFPALAVLTRMPETVETRLPTNLAAAIEIASTFSQENADDNQVLIKMQPNGKVMLRAHSGSGWHEEHCTITPYEGAALAFKAPPNILQEALAKKNVTVEFGGSRLRIKQGNFLYIGCLSDA